MIEEAKEKSGLNSNTVLASLVNSFFFNSNMYSSILKYVKFIYELDDFEGLKQNM